MLPKSCDNEKRKTRLETESETASRPATAEIKALGYQTETTLGKVENNVQV